jgi:hypothetical protein
MKEEEETAMKILFKLMVISFTVIIASHAQAEMTRTDAQICLDRFVSQAQGGAILEDLLQTYLQTEYIITIATGRSGRSVETIRQSFNILMSGEDPDSGEITERTIDLSSVEQVFGGQKITFDSSIPDYKIPGYEIAGRYNDAAGVRVLFGLKIDESCRIYNFSIDNVWIIYYLSR